MAGWKWGEKEKCTCAACNKEILLRPSAMKLRNFCSPECEKSSKIVTCALCGKEVKKYQTRRYKEKDYCSEECRTKATYNCKCDYCGKEYHAAWVNKRNYCCEICEEEGKKAEAEARKNYTCEYCGKKFERKSNKAKGKEKMYCSHECHMKGMKRDAQERKIYAICMYCGRTFEGRSYCPNKFCSVKCSSKYYAEEKWAEARKEKERAAEIERQKQELIAELKRGIKELKARQKEIKKYKACKCCGKIFKSNRPSYCSDECARRADNARHDKRIYRNGKPDLSINLFKLYKRDSGVCKLCGKLTNFTADIQADEYPSIDHIIPLSKGGKHEWNNVQLAHRGCNDLKSDKITPASSFS